MNNPRPASNASPSLQQPTVGPGDPAELRVRMTDRLLAGGVSRPTAPTTAPSWPLSAFTEWRWLSSNHTEEALEHER